MTIYDTGGGIGGPASSTAASAQAIMANKVSWGAIFAGVTIALVSQVILTMVGAGVGMATLDPGAGTGANPSASAFSIGAAVWTLISALVSAFLGGFVAARMSGRLDRGSASLHGLTTWAFTTLLVLYLLTTTVGGAIGGVSSALGNLGTTAVQTAAPAIASSDINPLEAIENEVRATGTDPEALQANAVNAIRALVTGGEDGAQQARDQAAQALAAARGIPVPQAQEQVARIEENYRQTLETAQQTATEAADATAAVVSKGALMAALALVLGAFAGWLGGRFGVAGRVDERLTDRRRA